MGAGGSSSSAQKVGVMSEEQRNIYERPESASTRSSVRGRRARYRVLQWCNRCGLELRGWTAIGLHLVMDHPELELTRTKIEGGPGDPEWLKIASDGTLAWRSRGRQVGW